MSIIYQTWEGGRLVTWRAPLNCVNCGAPLGVAECEYCGTRYGPLVPRRVAVSEKPPPVIRVPNNTDRVLT